MTPIPFTEETTEYAKDQEEYKTLPCHRDSDGTVTICWKLDLWERIKLLLTGRLWHQILTFNNPLQPQLLLIFKPEIEEGE